MRRRHVPFCDFKGYRMKTLLLLLVEEAIMERTMGVILRSLNASLGLRSGYLNA